MVRDNGSSKGEGGGRGWDPGYNYSDTLAQVHARRRGLSLRYPGFKITEFHYLHNTLHGKAILISISKTIVKCF